MYDFQYVRPANVVEAKAALAGSNEAVLLAGGQTLIPTLKQRLRQPSVVIDLGGVRNLGEVQIMKDKIMIGAMTTHAVVAASPILKKRLPGLAALAGGIGDPHVRNRGTIGGSIANADPAADYPAAVVALNADIVTERRTISSDSFFKGLFETALARDEIVTSVHFKVPEAAAYAKFPNPASRYALVGVFVAKFKDGVRVAVTGAGPRVFRLSVMEDALSSNFSPAALNGIAVESGGLNSDLHAAADYRAHLIGVMARRAVAAAGG
ncbi:MAG: xanthine dehydrogenase family protein subunit M [Rhodospirillaceae bacterium]|nr:xanthine dehydrogenase family protein subunit M [Rhodospirillaceae bacterium]